MSNEQKTVKWTVFYRCGYEVMLPEAVNPMAIGDHSEDLDIKEAAVLGKLISCEITGAYDEDKLKKSFQKFSHSVILKSKINDV